MLPNKSNKERKGSYRNPTAILSCAVGLLVLLVVCSIILIIINYFTLHDRHNIGTNEINYLFLVQAENESETSSPKDFDASVIDGGVVKVIIDNPYTAEELGIVPSGAPLAKSDEDLLFRYFAYLGAFGWNYIGIDENTFIFSRNS